ncbi:hypothetical protein SKAU_G00358850 [Synaphobranchus kaupii]|uniref:Uncharacterized protein n=1 Tax=Synaphobranchus kaupii TaxID=118154 RepID=A0A9Q1EHW7_SYNKA|nr:hypothetical protein SKAU_G00358850 [Synaphobranchus kaupii]
MSHNEIIKNLQQLRQISQYASFIKTSGFQTSALHQAHFAGFSGCRGGERGGRRGRHGVRAQQLITAEKGSRDAGRSSAATASPSRSQTSKRRFVKSVASREKEPRGQRVEEKKINE